jgi:hypothetical protein
VIFTATEKLEAVRRELGWRRKVYPNRVLTHRMTPQEAAFQIAIMEAIADEYERLAQSERLI